MATVEQLNMSSVVLLCIAILLVAFLVYHRKIDRLGIRLDESRQRHAKDDHVIRNLQSSNAALKLQIQEANRRNEENLDYFLAEVQSEIIPPDIRRRMRGPTTITTVHHV